jgi:hypothetical protein
MNARLDLDLVVALHRQDIAREVARDRLACRVARPRRAVRALVAARLRRLADLLDTPPPARLGVGPSRPPA